MIRHIGSYVRDIHKMGGYLLALGFSKEYDEIEHWKGKDRRIQKWMCDSYRFEMIEDRDAPISSFHFCFYRDIPEAFKNFEITIGSPKDPTLNSWFIFTGDALYFEFVRAKE